MIPQDLSSQEDEVSFGPFILRVSERVLKKGATPVHLTPRALDILLVLLEQAGSVVDKKDLMARVWSDVTVDAGSLRFHIGVLRKVLGEGEAGARFVATVPGKGYSFVCPVSYRMSAEAEDHNRVVEPNYGLPPRLSRMIGRDEVVKKVCEMLFEDRFVTIVGPGGIGKTTVAIAAAHESNPQIDGAVAFFDLGPLNDPMLVPTAVASTLGLMVQSDDPTPAIISFIRDKSMLLVLDSCEHVITSAAALAEHVFQHAPNVRILATSREALRVEGEYVLQLPSLENPPLNVQTVSDVLAFPAAQLFVDRVLASGSSFELNDADAPTVGEICRRLDGIALAIEIAASRVTAFGIKGTAALLDDRFRLLGQGRRTALQRHQTLAAALDWSYGLLSDNESLVLRRSSVFVGYFSMRAVIAVVGPDDLSEELAFEAVGSLVDKSLIAVVSGSSEARYRLLDTTRAYALSKLMDCDDDNGVFQRHAIFYLTWAEQHDIVRLTEVSLDGGSAYDPHLGNMRAALEWCFLQTEKSIGIALAAAAAPLLLESSLVTECRRWTELAIVNLDDLSRGTSREVTLQAALGLSLMFSQGNNEEARTSLERGLEVAEGLEDLPSQLQLIGRLHLFHYRTGNFREALKFAERSEPVALKMNDPGALAAANSLLGVSHHLMEELEQARGYLESAVRHIPASKHVDSLRLGLDYRNRAGICLARTLWLLGYADRATELARQVSVEAGKLNHPLTLCIALIWAVSVYLWNGDWENAEQSIERLIDHARNRAIVAYEAAGIGVRGYLAVMRGDHQAGLPMLRYALIETRSHRYELMTTAFKSALAEGLLMAGQTREALEAADDALATVARNGDMFNAAELLRIKGHVFMAETMKDMPRAEVLFIQSLEAAKASGARAWELRTATSLAGLWRSQRRFQASVELLEDVLANRTEGFSCPDFVNARKLLSDCARLAAPD
ncbi:winged helix-turn-helix domain-containing protein [Bradyrhizobium ontarionense]|uniref:Winged helix-turn-helix domain-containing protein n=1 Tax=Bradyrhizobium ontarionense TaxID=2898149 RepID=A0ABY3RK08_9BRAD|nr:winged helix-turn-helix domain-containing protein [Bradyrhizobium sp. A19]UFZ07181.1 winged helix-turn-helix domain-containing protein [Bradyrhizobium sp. A19]